jgi:hypothetical protein
MSVCINDFNPANLTFEPTERNFIDLTFESAECITIDLTFDPTENNTIDLTSEPDCTSNPPRPEPTFEELFHRFHRREPTNMILCDNVEEDTGIQKFLLRKGKCKKVQWVTKDTLDTYTLNDYFDHGSVSIETYLNFHRRSKRCSICTEKNPPPDSYTRTCKHYFHRKCIGQWMKIKHSCPMCRVDCNPRDIVLSYLTYFSDDEMDSDEDNDHMYEP